MGLYLEARQRERERVFWRAPFFWKTSLIKSPYWREPATERTFSSADSNNSKVSSDFSAKKAAQRSSFTGRSGGSTRNFSKYIIFPMALCSILYLLCVYPIDLPKPAPEMIDLLCLRLSPFEPACSDSEQFGYRSEKRFFHFASNSRAYDLRVPASNFQAVAESESE